MRVVVVGGVAGGMSAAARLRRRDEGAEIIVLERSKYVSFANCGLPYYVGGEIEEGIDDVVKREANSRAGYVYVISNIGSFGERMVKIGMTRRLDPMDRVRELGDASVPFNFDVHALFFSDDAVSVETELHHRFAAKRVNRINARREFFYATPAEVREALKDIAGNLLEFTEEPEAEQYRLSLEEARASTRC